MKTIRRISEMFLALAACFAMLPADPSLAFDSGSTGADGALEVTQNTELQLPPEGVFNFTTVHIAPGAALTFKKNEKNTPVTILASGDVLIEGSINVGGKSGSFIIPGEGGPGGFDGGVGGAANEIGRRGEGPGGGAGGSPHPTSEAYGGCGGGGGFAASGESGGGSSSAAPGGAGGASYGNERILPLIGGSGGGGGGGSTKYTGGAGAGGGGAMVIASSGTIKITGGIYANGGGGAVGNGPTYSGGTMGGTGGGGAGGSLRLIADTVAGSGSITAVGGGSPRSYNYVYGGTGSAGRIRFEASNVAFTGTSNPPMSLGYPYAVVPPDMPSLKIAAIAGVPVPAVTGGDFSAPDVTLPYNARNPVSIVVQATNIPAGQTVTVKANPPVGSTTSATAALSGTLESSAATVELNISTAYPSVLTAFVTFELSALNLGPVYFNGEKIDKVRVAATMSGGSEVTYITESGREIPATM